MATPSPEQVRDGSGLARILAHIPDPTIRSYVTSSTIYGQLAQGVGAAIGELEARIAQNPVAPVAPQQADGPVPRITDPEAAAIVEMLETSLGVRFTAPRAVSDIMGVLGALLNQLREANGLLEGWRARLIEILAAEGNLGPAVVELIGEIDSLKARATQAAPAPGAKAPGSTGGCA